MARPQQGDIVVLPHGKEWSIGQYGRLLALGSAKTKAEAVRKAKKLEDPYIGYVAWEGDGLGFYKRIK